MINSCYIHIPFCNNICTYCDFCKQFYNEKLVEKYLNQLEMEIKSRYHNEKLKTIYIGGGTPSSLSLNNLCRLFSIVKMLNKDISLEFTMEVNPESIDLEKLLLMKKNGVNRISIGIETTNNDLLKYLGRRHDFNLVKEKISLIKKAGFKNINVDLMYALQNETMDILKTDLDNVLSLDINHISTYSIMINPNTILGINKEKNIDEEIDYQMYDYICKYLKEHGFNHYEVSNFCKDNCYSLHNLTYWNNCEYYGFGLSASGYINDIRYDNTKSMHDYLNGNYVKYKEKLLLKDKISYELILGFRKINGINKKVFKDKYHQDVKSLYNIKELIKKGDIIEDDNNIFINYDKIYIENSILINFVEEEYYEA